MTFFYWIPLIGCSSSGLSSGVAGGSVGGIGLSILGSSVGVAGASTGGVVGSVVGGVSNA
jgi:hypothetical protein